VVHPAGGLSLADGLSGQPPQILQRTACPQKHGRQASQLAGQLEAWLGQHVAQCFGKLDPFTLQVQRKSLVTGGKRYPGLDTERRIAEVAVE